MLRCSKCGKGIRQGRRYCTQCGARASSICSECGESNEPDENFCGSCGATLATDVTISLSKSVNQGLSAGRSTSGKTDAFGQPVERRHLTVLFSDLVNSTEISARLDPENWRDIVSQYQRSSAEAVARFGGYLARYLGDGLMVFFGWPEAHEDDPERAVRAGLAIVAALRTLNRRFADSRDPELAVRIGIDSGSVVVGQGEGAEVDVFGDTPNIASRVQALAEPNSVLITSAVYELVPGLFAVEDRGAEKLKGIVKPIGLYRVIEATRTGRFRVAAARGLTPFVGREEELHLLVNRWETAREGRGQVILISGEAGIGKSRLLEEFRKRIVCEPHFWTESGASPLNENTPFYAVTEIILNALPPSGDHSENLLAYLEGALRLAGLRVGEALPLIAEMLNLAIPVRYTQAIVLPEQKRRTLLGTLVRWAFELARIQPLIILLEDLHWADPSTVELTELLAEQGATERLLLICTARPEFRPPWSTLSHHSQITVHNLSDEQTREMVARVSTSPLSESAIDLVVKRTTGVPLFIEELTRTVIENSGADAEQKIPVTLRDSLMARLDRLGPAKEIAQIASVIGNEFSYDTIRSLCSASDEDLHRCLRSLSKADILYTHGLPPEATYSFRHALIRDAAYSSLLQSHRRKLHHRLATKLERFGALVDPQPEILAHHWTAAEESGRAVDAWQNAASGFAARGAFVEAERAYRRALATLEKLSKTPERDARELELCSAFVQVLELTKGYSAPETVEAAVRARLLADRAGNLTQVIQQEVRTWRATFVKGDYAAAAKVGDHILDLARRAGEEPKHLVLAYGTQVQARFYRGDLVGVEEHLAHLRDLTATAGPQEPGDVVITIGVAALTAWAMGKVDLARERIARAINFGRQSKNPYDLAFALLFESYLYRVSREPRRAEVSSAEMLHLSEHNGFSYGCDLARGILGWARAHLGAAREGVSTIQKALDGLLKAGTRVGITDVFTRLAEAQALDGAKDAALDTIEQGLRANPEEVIFRPAAITFRGNLRLPLGRIEQAEADFREAIAMSRGMSAKVFELRPATSLARSLKARGYPDDARNLLASVYSLFSEDLALLDLTDARDLLTELRT